MLEPKQKACEKDYIQSERRNTAHTEMDNEQAREKQKTRYYSPSAPLKEFFAKLSCTEGYNIKEDVTKLNTKMIYATLLPIKKIKFCISNADKIILSMHIVQDND